MQILDKGKNILLHDGVHLLCGIIVEHRPFERFAVDLAVADHHLILEDALKRQSEHGAFFGFEVVRVVKVVDKHQIGDLLDNVEGVGQTACPEYFPYAVDFTFEFSCNHASFSLFQV